jgi:hypothetical protein
MATTHKHCRCGGTGVLEGAPSAICPGDPNTPAVIEASESMLYFAVGYLCGSMDRRLGTGTAWVMRSYMQLNAMKWKGQPITLDYVLKLETDIGHLWPGPGSPPLLRDVL